MAPSPRKKVTIQYRKLDDSFPAFMGKKLQSLLSDSLKQEVDGQALAENPAKRTYPDDGYGTLVLNYFVDKPDYFFGEIVRFEPGANLPLLDVADGAQAYNLKQMKPLDGHEPIRGVLYFMALRNHLVLIEADVSSSRAERYLSWLISEKAKLIEQGSQIILLAELTNSGAPLQLEHVEEIVFKPRPFSPEDEAQKNGDDISRDTGKTQHGVTGTNVLEVMKAAGMDEVDIRNIVSKKTQIQVTLQILFRGERRSRSPLSTEDTNRLLRNMPDYELTLKGPGGRQRNGRIEKLSYSANIETVGSLLSPQDVARALYEAYNSFLKNGYVDG